jgi:hypothetical protein
MKSVKAVKSREREVVFSESASVCDSCEWQTKPQSGQLPVPCAHTHTEWDGEPVRHPCGVDKPTSDTLTPAPPPRMWTRFYPPPPACLPRAHTPNDP